MSPVTVPWEGSSKIIDLHNDLLWYLAASPQHSAYDDITHASIPQLQRGRVGIVTFSIFSETKPRSQFQLGRQLAAYQDLLNNSPGDVCPCSKQSPELINLLLAIENTSTFLGEKEPLDEGVKRFYRLTAKGTRFLYVSLTWNFENRCGGGTHSTKGLTCDGKRILDMLEEYTTAIDLSHASDQLAYDILRYLDESKSALAVIASHANFRAVTNVPRNVPDEIAGEICRRGGVIGLTAIKQFVGERLDMMFDHIEYGLQKGWGASLAFGTDFFTVPGLSPEQVKAFDEEHFFEGLSDISALSSFVDTIAEKFGPVVAKRLAYQNAWERLILPHLSRPWTLSKVLPFVKVTTPYAYQ